MGRKAYEIKRFIEQQLGVELFRAVDPGVDREIHRAAPDQVEICIGNCIE